MGWSLAAPKLLVRREGDSLRISAPQIRFLNGKPLEQLKNGAKVSFISQIAITGEGGVMLGRPHVDRFVISYDLWEEKFAATRLGPPAKSANRLNIPAAEAFCLDSLTAIPPALTPARPFWIKLELRAEDPRDASAIVGEPGINLTRLVEVFSRPPRSLQPRWTELAGPLRLQDL
jgi:hypothetical protein